MSSLGLKCLWPMGSTFRPRKRMPGGHRRVPLLAIPLELRSNSQKGGGIQCKLSTQCRCRWILYGG